MSLRIAGVLLAVSVSLPAAAAIYVWRGEASNRFSDPRNWDGGSPAGDPEAELVFPDAVRQSLVNDLHALAVRSIVFETNGYELHGNTIDLLEGATVDTRENAILCPLRFDGSVVDGPVRGHLMFARAATATAPRGDAQSTIFTFDKTFVSAKVTPFTDTAWIAVIPKSTHYGRLEAQRGDTDGDGVVQWMVTESQRVSKWCVVDIAARQVHAAKHDGTAVELRPLHVRFLLGDNGAYSAADLNWGTAAPSMHILWVRPGIGAWVGYPSRSATIDGQYHTIVEARQLYAVEASPDTPAGFQRGDILVGMSSDPNADGTTTGGLVDAALNATQNNPAEVALSVSDVFENSPDPNFALVRFGSTERAITVSYRVTGDTAIAGVHFQPTAGTVTLARGELLKKIPVSLIDDDVYSGATTLRIELTGASGATLVGTTPQLMTILDGEHEPAAIPQNATVVEGGDGLRTAPMKVTLARKARVPIEFTWISGGEGAPSTTWEKDALAAGETEKTILVPYYGNTLPQSDRRLAVLVKSRGTFDAQVIVQDDDSVGAAGQSVDVTEGASSVTVKVTLDAPLAEPVTIGYATNSTRADAGDYDSVSGTLTFAPGETEKSVVVPLHQDTIPEDVEPIGVELSAVSPANFLIRRHGEIVLRDDGDKLMSVSITGPDPVEEGSDIDLTVRASSPVQAVVVIVGARLVAGTASPDLDYSLMNYPKQGLHIGASVEGSGRLRLLVWTDSIVEPDETFAVEIFDFHDPSRVLGRLPVVIKDTTARLPRLRISDDRAREGSVASFEIGCGDPAPATITFRVTTVADTAESDVDFTPVANVYTIERGQRGVTVDVKTHDDGIVEGDETFSLKVSEVSNAIAEDAIGRATIVDDDSPAPVISVAHVAVLESEATARFVVELAASSTQRVTLTYTTLDGTALAGEDYVAVEGTLVFDPGETTRPIVVSIVNDGRTEPEEAFTVRVGTTDAVCAIVNDDATTGRRRAVRH